MSYVLCPLASCPEETFNHLAVLTTSYSSIDTVTFLQTSLKRLQKHCV